MNRLIMIYKQSRFIHGLKYIIGSEKSLVNVSLFKVSNPKIKSIAIRISLAHSKLGGIKT